MAEKKHFYAVRKGRVPGIYLIWGGPGGAEEQVKGYPGAVFQGFATRREADDYLRGAAAPRPPAEKAAPLLPGDPPGEQDRSGMDYQADLRAGKVVIFTDGASTGNPGPGGYGVVLLNGGTRKELSGGFRCTTNNRMELAACIAALSELKRPAEVVLYSDSRYVVNAVEKGWARRWRSQGWLRAPDRQGSRQPAENIDLWEKMLALLERIPVEFRWVKGHARHPENERCDRLAVQAARGRNLPEDAGFRGVC